MDVSIDILPQVNTADVHQQSHLQSLNTARFWLRGVAEYLAFQLLGVLLQSLFYKVLVVHLVEL